MIAKTLGVVAVALFTAITGALGADPITTGLGSAATIIGLAALIWKLVTDHKVEQSQGARWEAMLQRADKRISELETEIVRLNKLLSDERGTR